MAEEIPGVLIIPNSMCDTTLLQLKVDLMSQCLPSKAYHTMHPSLAVSQDKMYPVTKSLPCLIYAHVDIVRFYPVAGVFTLQISQCQVYCLRVPSIGMGPSLFLGRVYPEQLSMVFKRQTERLTKS